MSGTRIDIAHVQQGGAGQVLRHDEIHGRVAVTNHVVKFVSGEG
jgi:hypothetical protein